MLSDHDIRHQVDMGEMARITQEESVTRSQQEMVG